LKLRSDIARLDRSGEGKARIRKVCPFEFARCSIVASAVQLYYRSKVYVPCLPKIVSIRTTNSY
jgi:hypothetical protein